MDDNVWLVDGEWYVIVRTVAFYAPTTMNDHEGEQLVKNVSNVFEEQVIPIIEEIEKTYNVRGAMR